MDTQTLLEEYYANNAVKLHLMVEKILLKFGGIYQKDYDDFYSLANEVFIDVLAKYNESQNFGVFLYSCLSNKIKSEMTKKNRIKRRCDAGSVSLDEPLAGGEGNFGDILPSDFDLEREISYRCKLSREENVIKYFKSLSILQREIVKYKMNGIHKNEIINRLNISEKIYARNFEQIKSYGKTKILHEKEQRTADEEEILMGAVTMQTLEKSKDTSLLVSSIIKSLKNYSIRGDHPLQRESEQWNSNMKSNFISDILQKNPIPAIVLAEQVRPNGTRDNWLIDGKQRGGNVASFKDDGFKISKNVERFLVEYQTTLRDEKGLIRLGEDGSPLYQTKQFDIRGKKYSDLPDELKEYFNDYPFRVEQYLNCSDEDIEYHIRRYNASRPMSAAQKGITHLGEQFARVAKKLTQHTFFKDKGCYRLMEFTNGTIDRVVVESIMAINFLGDWKKKQEEICNYLKENVKLGHFDSFENALDRLAENVTEETSRMFNSKDSFLWFALFGRFSKSGLEDEKFIDFLQIFKRKLHTKEVNNISYDSLNQKSTKDKTVVIQKLNLLETLMNEFLHIDNEETFDEFKIESETIADYIAEFMDTDIIKAIDIKPETDNIRAAVQSLMLIHGETDISDRSLQKFILHNDKVEEEIENTLLYLSGLNEWSLGVNNNSIIFDKINIPALVKLVGYCYQNENDIDESAAIKWFEGYVANFETNGGYAKNAVESYKKMVSSLRRYISYMKKQ